MKLAAMRGDVIMVNFILEPLQYAFIQRALIASMLVGVCCALLGVYVVLRRIANIGHALTHSALPGLVIAFTFKINLFVGALAATLLTAFGIGALSKDDKVYEDTATGMLPTMMFAVGVLLISATHSYRDMSAMLFGNILGVSNADLWLIVAVTLTILMVFIFIFKEMMLYCVDGDYAANIGINTSALRYLLLFLLCLAVVVGISAVGTILTNALLIVPVAAARLITNKMKGLIIYSIAFACFSCVGGVYLSYYMGLSSGASIVLISSLIFLVIWLWRRVKN